MADVDLSPSRKSLGLRLHGSPCSVLHPHSAYRSTTTAKQQIHSTQTQT